MATLKVFLFGRFRLQCGQRWLTGLEACKAQELFFYLLLYRQRAHPRETLSDLLWRGHTAPESKRYLRKAVWQIQATLEEQAGSLGCRVLQSESDWIQINPDLNLWLDVAVFEQAFELVRGRRGREIDDRCAQTLKDAIDLYRGDLLEGCYQDWCIYERERFQHMYLAMLDKLMDHCEACREYEEGLGYGCAILRCDRARERTHRRLMRLHYLARNRTEALRQYAQCVNALREELGVGPSRRTTALYEQIQADRLVWPPLELAEPRTTLNSFALPLYQTLEYLKQLYESLLQIEGRVEQEIQAVESRLGHRS